MIRTRDCMVLLSKMNFASMAISLERLIQFCPPSCAINRGIIAAPCLLQAQLETHCTGENRLQRAGEV